MRKCVLPAMLLGGLTSCGDIPTAPPRLTPASASRDVGHVYIPGRYIVRFKPVPGTNASIQGALISSSYGGVVDRVYTSAINGAAMRLSDVAAAALSNDSRVLSVEQDEVLSKHWVQGNPTWGLDRIDQRVRPLSSSYTYLANGGGVTVYILDSGINYGQADFAGRASPGIDAITIGGDGSDCDGHGSHVAGTVGSATYGVAKNVRLVSVRVLDCLGNGTSSSVLAGIDWVTNHRVLPAVANMSLGGATNSTVNFAVESSISSGVTYVVSAGNNAVDACGQSPASAPNVITVGATDASDAFASYSNFGSCVDILAPGTGITSWWTGSGTNTISGTSMSTPHVTGAAALYLQTNPSASPAQVRTALLGNATTSVVTGVPAATPNLLLYTGFIPAATAPSAQFTATCTGTTCAFDASASTSAWGPAATYAWTFGDASGSALKSPSHTYASLGTYTVSLTVTDPNGANTKTTSVVLNRPPVPTISSPGANLTFAAGAPVSFAGTALDPEDGALAGASLAWSSDRDGPIGTGAAFTTTTLSVGAHVITLTATDSRGTAATVSRVVTITSSNQAPVARFTWSCPTLQCTMDASSSTDDAGIVKYTWAWGDGRTESKVQPIAKNTWAAANIYTISLTVTDAGGLTNTLTRQVSIPNSAPVAAISAPGSNSTSVQGTAVTFSGSATDLEDGAIAGSALSWTSSIDGVLGTGASVSTSALSLGTHVITLSAHDAQNAVGTATRTIVVAPNSIPVPTITAPSSGSATQAGTSVTFAGNATDVEDGTLTGGALTWMSSIDGAIGTGTSFSLSTLSVGTHVVTLTARDALSATATTTVSITIVANQAPTASIAAPAANGTFVLGTPISFTGSAVDPEDGSLTGASLTWSSNLDGVLGTGASFSTTALSAGTHTITLTARDSRNATATAARTIIVAAISNQAPVARFTWSCPTLQCTMDASTSTDDAGIVKYTWAWGDGRTEGKTQPIARNTWQAANTYTITLTVMDAGGLTNSVSRQVSIPNQSPTASITAPAPGSVYILGAGVTLTGSGSDLEDGALSGASLTWSSSIDGALGTGATVTTSGLSAGTHVITLTARDAQAATGSATRSIVINAPPSVVITSPAGGTTFTKGATVVLSGTGSDAEDGALAGASLTWTSNRDGQIGTGATLSTSTLSLGTHTITLTATDSRGASTSVSRTLIIAANQPPTATVMSPANGSVVLIGTSVMFTGSGSDAEDGALAGASLSWSSSVDGVLGSGATLATSALSGGVHTITLTARDGMNATGTASITLTVNRPPTASISSPVSGTSAPMGAAISFAGSGSDPDQGALTGAALVWRSSRDGQIGTGNAFTTSGLSAGAHVITLTATDANGVSATASVSVNITIIANQPPVATILTPLLNSSFATGQSVAFSGTGIDPEDGVLAGSSLVWTSSINGPIGTGTAFSTSTLSPGGHVITLTVTDSRNATMTVTRTIFIRARFSGP